MAYFNINEFLGKVDAHGAGFQRTTQFRCKIDVSTIGALANAADIGPVQTLGSRLVAKYPKASQLLNEGLLCEVTSTPSRAFENATLSIYGLEEKHPVYTTYTDHDCRFLAPLVERNGKQHNDVANIFHEWQDAIQDANVPHRGTQRLVGDVVTTNNPTSKNQQFPDEYRLTEGMVLDQFSAWNEKKRGGILGVNINAQGNVRDGIRRFNQISRWFDGPQIPDRFRWEWGDSENGDSKPSLSYKFFNVFPQLVESTPLAWMGDADIQRISVKFTYSYWNVERPKNEAETNVVGRIVSQ